MRKGFEKQVKEFIWWAVVLNPARVFVTVVVITGVLFLVFYHWAVTSPSFMQFPE